MSKTTRLGPIVVMLAIVFGLFVMNLDGCTSPQPVRPSVVFTDTVSDAP